MVGGGGPRHERPHRPNADTWHSGVGPVQVSWGAVRMRALLGAVGAILAALTGCGSATPSTSATISSAAVPDGDVIVLVNGWRPSELATILTRFERKYELGAGILQASEATDGTSRITLRHPLPADRLLFLINYLHYPDSFDQGLRSPVAVAIARLSPAFGVTEPPLLGRMAAFYVPENDARYDEVYATVDDGSAFRLSFSNLAWEPVEEGRRSSAVAALQRSAPAL